MTASPPPTHARRDGEGTRQRLLRAALELFTTEGFLATTTPVIAQRAGVAEGTIYRHFSGKEHLLNEVYRGTQRWATVVVREIDADRSLRVPERLARIARRLAESAERDPAAVRMLLRQRDGQFLDPQSRDAAREFRDALQQVVAAGKADGLVRAGQQITAGETLSETFQNLGVFPPLVIRMLRVGENTGALDTALMNITYVYNRDVKESVDKAQKALGPALTLVLGGLLGFVVWAVLGPVYDILGKIKF